MNTRTQPLLPRLRATLAVTLAAAACAAVAQGVPAEGFIPPGDEALILNLGGILNQYGTTIQLNGAGVAGTSIDLEQFGLPRTQSSVFATATWRFLPTSRVDLMYFGAKRSGSRTLDREVTVDGTVIPVNASVSAQNTSQFVLANYRYSFVKTDALEVAAALGVYGGQFKYRITATQALAGGSQETLVDATASTTVPLPLIGLSVDWYLTPRWKISATAEGIKARIGDVDGSAVVAGVNTDYMVTRNLGLGVGYMYSNLDVDVTKSGFDGNLAWESSGVTAYAQLRF